MFNFDGKGGLRAALLASAALGVTTAASAQEQARSAPDTIVVLGEKTERSLQETTTSVDVTTAADIENLNIVTLDEALQRVGNAGFVTTGGGDNVQFTLRGVQSGGVTTGGGTVSVASLYVDGALVPNQVVGTVVSNAWDVRQIEVLRGAQSTVQGRNALIGAIVVRTNEPGDEFNYALRATYGEYGTSELSAAAGLPFANGQAGLRVSAQHLDSEGYIERPDGLDGNPLDSELYRGKLVLEPDALPNLSATFTVMASSETRGGALVDSADPDARVQLTDIPTRTNRDLELYSGEIVYGLTDSIDLVSLTTYSKIESDGQNDFDGLPDLGFPIPSQRTFDREITDFMQEVRLDFSAGRFSGIVGALYAESDFYDESLVTQTAPIPAFDLRTLGLDAVYQGVTAAATGGLVSLPTPPGAPFLLNDPLLFGSLFPLQSEFVFEPTRETTAVFADIGADVTDRFRVTAGFRWEQEEATYSASQTNTLLEASDAAALTPGGAPGLAAAVQAALEAQLTPFVGPANAQAIAAGATPSIVPFYSQFTNGALAQLTGPNFLVPISLAETEEFDVFLPKFTASYDVSELVTVSASAQKAYRAGGLGINPVQGFIYSFDPEFSWNYELALRSQSADGRLTFNTNVFYIDWEDQQVEVQITPTPQDTAVVNAGASRLYGAEAQLAYDVTDALNVFATLGVLDTEITEDNRSAAEVANAGGLSLEGSEFPFAPGVSGALGFTYDHSSGISATFDVNYRGESEPLLPNRDDLRSNDAYAVVNGRVAYDFGRGSVFVFGSNLFDETYLTNAQAAGGSVVVGAPQVFGVGLTLRN
ncbi:MAG: TonB-dependent receptor [Oceanicaulis sp.]